MDMQKGSHMKLLSAFFLVVLLLGAGYSWSQDISPALPETSDVMKMTLNAVYPDELRVVINDREYYLKGHLVINGQEVSANAALLILRTGQSLSGVRFTREGENQRLILQGVDTL